jgi:outer membrane protein
MTPKIPSLLLILLFSFCSFARAEIKVGTVDMDRIFKQYKKTEEIKNKFNASASVIEKEFNNRSADLQKKIEEINQLKALISKGDSPKEVLEAKSQECEAKISKASILDRELAEYRSAKQKKLDEDSLVMRKEIINDIMTVINDQTKVRGFDIVLDKSGLSAGAIPVVLFARPEFDISDNVLAILNKKASH